MALTKDAILRLKLEGFNEAAQRAGAVGRAFQVAHQAALRFAAGVKGATGAASSGLIAASKGTAQVVDGFGRAEAASRRLEGSFTRATAAATRMGAAGRQAGRSTETALSGAGGALSTFGGGITKARIALASLAVGVGAAFATLSRGGEVAGVANAFEKLSGGGANAGRQLDALKSATQGAVSETALMTGANRLMLSGLQLTEEQMSASARAAVLLGRAQGFSGAEAFDRLTLALAKQEPELLDEIGLKVDLTAALRREAEARGVAVTSLDAQARGQIFANAVMEQAKQRSAQLGDAMGNAAPPIEALAIQWQNMIDRFAEMIAQNPQILQALERIGEAAIKLATAMAPVVEAVASVGSFLFGGQAAAVSSGLDAVGVGRPLAPSDRFRGAAAAAPAGSPAAFQSQAGSAFDSYGRALEAAARESGRATARRIQLGGL